jgi:Bacterial capsule synthesis protein PGA_cap
MSSAVDLMFVGDLILSASNASFHFDHVRSTLAGADVAVAQVEWPHTDRGQVCTVDIPAPAVPPGNLDAVAECGFGVATLASNHMFDQGPFGVIDTVEHLRRRQIQTVGAGATLADAREPVVVEHGGLRIGFLSYNAVGPRESWATEVKAGVAYVRVLAHYELDIASPGSPPAEYTSLDGDSVIAMQTDIEQLAARTECVVVSIHKGMGFVHAQLAEYERPLARLAVDAGADVVIGHHAHILRGVEVYKDRPIFHGINHFVTAYTDETDPLSDRARRPRPRRAPSLDFFSPDRDVEHFPFPRDSRHTMIARVRVNERGVCQAGFVPCYINERAQPVPVPVAAGAGEDATTEYIARITQDAGLEAMTFTRKDGWVTFLDQAA